ncbi:MAG: hypothetical protein IBX62_04900 [Coriobacteriia bacterium]|nr:hypothetical protein [Coriobacteriia bacterium]
MPTRRVDLHNHTPYVYADYHRPEASAEEVVAAAADAGIDVFGATDHFSVAFCRRLIEVAAWRAAGGGGRVLVLPGAELKVRHGDDEVHLIALFPPDGSLEKRFDTLTLMLDLPTPVAHVERLADVVCARDPVEVARAVATLGGVCHVGHADRRFGEYCLVDRPVLGRLAAEPSVSAVEMLDPRLAHGRLSSATIIRSSDAHSPEEIGRRTAELPMPELSFEGLRRALRSERMSLPA